MKKEIINIFILGKNKLKWITFIKIGVLIFILIVSIATINIVSSRDKDKKEFNNIDLLEGNELSEKLVDYLENEGIQTNDGVVILPSLIRNIDNVELSDGELNEGEEFSLNIKLNNGVCFQQCKLKGELNYIDDKMAIKNVQISSKESIYKEGEAELDVIQKIICDEIERDGVFKFEKSNKYKEKYLKINKNSIEDIEIKDFKVRDDYSIRAEISGEIYLQEYDEKFIFNGIVVISGKLSEGRGKNAKEIVIYDVPS